MIFHQLTDTASWCCTLHQVGRSRFPSDGDGGSRMHKRGDARVTFGELAALVASVVGMVTASASLIVSCSQYRLSEDLRRQQMALQLIHMPPSVEYVYA